MSRNVWVWHTRAMVAPPGDFAQVDLPITEIGGLPLHPLLVHAVVVLIPLTALGIIVMASSGARSKRYSPAVIFVAVSGVASAFLAMWAGQALRAERPGLASQHFTLGLYVPWVALLLLVMVLLLALMDRQGGGRSAIGTIVAFLAVLVALGAVGLTVATGHTGSMLVWG